MEAGPSSIKIVHPPLEELPLRGSGRDMVENQALEARRAICEGVTDGDGDLTQYGEKLLASFGGVFVAESLRDYAFLPYLYSAIGFRPEAPDLGKSPDHFSSITPGVGYGFDSNVETAVAGNAVFRRVVEQMAIQMWREVVAGHDDPVSYDQSLVRGLMKRFMEDHVTGRFRTSPRQHRGRVLSTGLVSGIPALLMVEGLCDGRGSTDTPIKVSAFCGPQDDGSLPIVISPYGDGVWYRCKAAVAPGYPVRWETVAEGNFVDHEGRFATWVPADGHVDVDDGGYRRRMQPSHGYEINVSDLPEGHGVTDELLARLREMVSFIPDIQAD